jgi:two-component system sensor histidine kinase VicK
MSPGSWSDKIIRTNNNIFKTSIAKVDRMSEIVLQYLKDGGEMGEHTRALDWSKTSLGDLSGWPKGLLVTLSTLLRSRAPMFLWWGPDLVQFYNDAYRPSFGNEGKHPAALGQHGADCWPEIWPVIKPLIDQVLSGGEAVWMEDQLIPIYRNNQLEDVYWTFGYSSVLDDAGQPGGVLVVCHETTEKVRSQQLREQTQRAIETAQAEAEQQRDQLVRFFMQAPAGICILNGPTLIFELVNPLYQQLFPGRKLLGLPLLEAVPEIDGQPIQQVLSEVYTTGQTFEGKELLIPLARTEDGPVEDRYFNFIYQAKKDSQGSVDGILVFVIEVTNMVTERKEQEKTQDTLKAAVTSAQLGTFDLDIPANSLKWNDRCRRLFGIGDQQEITYEGSFLAGLHPHDLKRVEAHIAEVFDQSVNNGKYDIEFRTIGVEDQRMRWIRAIGQAYFNQDGKPIRFVGSALDITEQKENELRKNDFIGMVSHELKTPLTSLKAYIQVLNAKAKKGEDNFEKNALAKADLQVKKMGDMINGFLNISRLESGKLTLVKQNFDLDELLGEIIDDIKITMNTHEISFAPCPPVRVFADKDKIGSVLTNLLNNAIKYSPKAMVIEVICKMLENGPRVSVRDKGLGIKPEDIPHIFDRYFRVESKYTAHISGFGIGLYLSAEIVKQHGGKIWVESEPGKGSTFYFSLPL